MTKNLKPASAKTILIAVNRKSSLVSRFQVFDRAASAVRRNWFEVFLLLLMAALLIWRGRGFIFAGDSTSSAAVLTSSVVVYILAFVIAEFFLKRQGVGFERYFVALACVASGIWIQQGLYHFGYADARMPTAVVNTLFTLNFNFDTSAHTYPLYWNLIMISLPFAAYKYMRFNRYFVLTALVGGGIYLLWIYSGYPQFFAPGWFQPSDAAIPLVPNNNSGITLWGFIFNSAFVIVALLPALLFYKKPEPKPVVEK